MNGEETRFKIGNREAEKWTLEETYNIILKMLSNTADDVEILSLQDAIFSVGLYPSSLNYLISKYPVFKSIKKDISDILISRINKKALRGDFNVTASIWRFKQLGERDERSLDVSSIDGSMSPKAPVSLDDWYNPKRGE